MTIRELHPGAWSGDFERLVGIRFDGRVDDATHAAGRERLVRAVSRKFRPSARWYYVLGAALAIGIAGFWYRKESAPTLTYWVDGQGRSDHGYMTGGPKGGRVVFSDGSELGLHSGARARVVDLTRLGGRLVLEGGRAKLGLVDVPQAKWSVAAGPFTLQTSGAELDVFWSDTEELLQIEVRRGKAVVSGPAVPQGFPLTAGQRLIASERTVDLAPLSASNP